MQYRIDFIDIFDALIDSMLDHGTFTKNQKTSATLHENAPAKNGTSAALHENAFRVFMAQLGASKSSPCDRTKHSFSNDFLTNLVLVGTHLVAAPGVITPGGAPRRGTDVRTSVGETGAGAQTPPATHPGKKYDVRRPTPHSDNAVEAFSYFLKYVHMQAFQGTISGLDQRSNFSHSFI